MWLLNLLLCCCGTQDLLPWLLSISVWLCSMWAALEAPVWFTASLSSAAASVVWDSGIQQTTETQTWIQLAFCTLYTHTWVQYAFCTFVNTYSGQWAFTHVIHASRFTRVYLHSLWMLPVVAHENPGHYLYLLMCFFQDPVRAEARTAHTDLALAVKKCNWSLCWFLFIA